MPSQVPKFSPSNYLLHFAKGIYNLTKQADFARGKYTAFILTTNLFVLQRGKVCCKRSFAEVGNIVKKGKISLSENLI